MRSARRFKISPISVQTPRPTHEISGREIVVRLDIHQPFQCLSVALWMSEKMSARAISYHDNEKRARIP